MNICYSGTLRTFWVLLLTLFINGQVQAGLKVAASIPPIHSLVAGVMQGVSTPDLLIHGSQSPHVSYLSPSTVRKIADADLVVWVGPQLEVSLSKAMDRIDHHSRLTLLEVEEIRLHKTRSGGIWNDHSLVDSEQSDPAAQSEYFNVDPHIWLSIENVNAIIATLADRLVKLDPGNTQQYRNNSIQMLARVASVRQRVAPDLKQLENRHWLVFHDAFQYFESELGMGAIGAITINPERPPGAKRIQLLRNLIVSRNIRCVFTEPQFSQKVMDTIVEDTDAIISIVDPLGSELPPGPDLWFDIYANLVTSLIDCVTKTR